jgi:PST family polysaccharide transporter
MRFGRIALLETLAMLLGTAAGVWAAAAGLRYWSLVVMQLTTSVVTLLLSLLLCGWLPGRPRRGAKVRELLRFGAHLMGYNAVSYLGKSADPALLGWRWGAAPVGLYDRARKLMQLPMTQVSAPVAQVALPALSRIPDDPARYRAAYVRLVEKLLILAMPGIAYLIAVSDWLVAMLLGPQWTECAALFAILGIGALVEPVCSSAGWLLLSQGRTREMLAVGVCDAALRFGLVALALPWGAQGVTVAVVLRLAVSGPLSLAVAGRRGPVSARDMARTLVAPGLAAAAAFGSALLVHQAPLAPVPGLLASAGVAAPAALVALWATRSGRRALKDALGSLASLRRPSPPAPLPRHEEEPANR